MLARIQPFSPLELHHAGSNWASDGLVIPTAGGIGGPKSVTAALVGQAQVLCLEIHCTVAISKPPKPKVFP